MTTLETLMDIDSRLVPDVLPRTDPELSDLEHRIEQEIIAAGVADDITAADLEALETQNYHAAGRAAARIRKLRSLTKHRIVATRATGKAIEDPATAVYIYGCLDACFSGDYGMMEPEAIDSNDLELASGEGRIMARYEQREQLREDVYIIAYFSEAEPDEDNNFTEILYVSEY